MSSRFTQYILARWCWASSWARLIFNFLPDSRVEIAADINLIAMLFLRLIKMIIAPLVFATLVGGIAHMGSGAKLGRIFAKTMGWFVSASFISLLLGLVMVNLLQPGANFPGTLPDKAPIDRPAGLGLLDREIPDPSDPDLDRGRDGAERDPADRGVRGVLRGRARRDAGTLEADHGADRRSRPHHAQGDRLCDAVRAGRGVGGDHGDGRQERPAGAVEAHRLHGRLLSLADDPVGHPGHRSASS